MTESVGTAFFGATIPFLDLLGARPGHREKGRAVVSLEMRDELTNSWHFAHGGVVMTLLDVAMGSAVRSTVTTDFGVVTANLNVSFLRSGAGSLTAEGRVLRGGKTLVFCEGEVRDAAGHLVAKGVGTFRLKKRKPPPDAR
ncbi:MAG: PaaI family thioesterase [Myxococcales bacterium]